MEKLTDNSILQLPSCLEGRGGLVDICGNLDQKSPSGPSVLLKLLKSCCTGPQQKSWWSNYCELTCSQNLTSFPPTVICCEAPVRHCTFTTVAFRFFLFSKGALDLGGASMEGASSSKTLGLHYNIITRSK